MKENPGSIKLRQSVAQFYETYGSAFSRSRFSGWEIMDRIRQTLRPGMTLLDVGSGNSRLADGLPEGVSYVAIEPSSSLRAEAMKRLGVRPSVQVLAGGFPKLPIEDDDADVTACIAVIHHIPTRVAQRAAIAELARVTKRGGTVFVTAWDLRSRRMFRMSTWLAAWLRLPMVQGGEPGDVWIPWKADGARAMRFVHAFTPGELKKLFPESDWQINRIEDDGRNLLVVATRK